MSSAPVFPDLKGKVAVVTGGSKGIGAGVCLALARNGARVAVSGRDESAIARLVDQIRTDGGEAIGVAADCTSSAEIKKLRERTERELGPADILIVFAGGFGSYTPTHLIDEAEWNTVLESNLTGTFLTVKSFLPGMIERRRGSIVTMGSIGGRYLDNLLTSSYAAAKAGIAMFTRHVAKEVGQYGIRVNCIAPGTVLSERVDRIMSDEKKRDVAAMAPLGRLGVVEDVVPSVLFLASDASGWMTGVTLDVNGGRVML